MSEACCGRRYCVRRFVRRAAGEVDAAEFSKLEDQCIRDVVALQEQVGLEIVTDGEFRRGSYWGRFVERIEGFEIKPASFKFRNDQGHEVEFTAPFARSKIKRKQPLALDEYLFLRDVTKVAGKITLPAPSTMHFYRCADFAEPPSYADVEFSLTILPQSLSRKSANFPRPVAVISSSMRLRWRCFAIRQSANRSHGPATILTHWSIFISTASIKPLRPARPR